MKLILTASSSSQETNFGCDYALIDLTPELVALIQRRFAMIDELNQRDRAVDRISFIDYSPVWFDPYEISDELGEKIEAVEDLINYGYAECGDITADLGDGARTESDRMVVSEWFVWWSCEPKHSGCTVESYLIDRKIIDPAWEKAA